MANRLANASSPYLRQHADNPVDWHEWGDEAFALAKEQDKPMFLSVGYASCHWCHVMAHESFEDPDIAQTLNRDFVSVKVDREERPDVDRVYMDALQAMTGQGGWPMSVFLTPDGAPFFAGTYWPKDERPGMPGFPRVLEAITDAWENERDRIEATGQQLTARLKEQDVAEGSLPPDEQDTAQAATFCVRVWDNHLGGFGRAPKFPHAMTVSFLLAHASRTGDSAALEAATHSLEQMSRGGIYDHVGGGFARYSVDAHWLVPHFEKMLYDNALLLRAYTHGALTATDAQQRAGFRRIVDETATYLIDSMQHPQGGFFSSTDADSEGVEGKFFVWSAQEFQETVAAAGHDPQRWAGFFGVTANGNFEGANILTQAQPRDEDDAAFGAAYREVRAALAARRETRVHPDLDDKVLTSWNGLVIGALAEAGSTFGRPEWIDAATRAASFIREYLTVDGQLHHTWRDGHGASVPAFAEDVAMLAQGLLQLYQATGDGAWFTWAQELAAQADRDFAERTTDGSLTGAYFMNAHASERLIMRPRESWDNATPSATSVMADVHLQLASLSGAAAHIEQADRILARAAAQVDQAPVGYGEMLRAAERRILDSVEVVITGDPAHVETQQLVAAYRSALHPGAVLAIGGDDPYVPVTVGRSLVDGKPAAYVCRNFTCQQPVTAASELRAALDMAAA